MAEIVASLLVQQLQNLLVEGNKLFGDLKDELQFLKNEFERMTAFLRVADTVQDKDPEVAVWIKQVREIARDTEDILDKYDVLILTHQGCVERFCSSIKNFRARSRLATEIKSIKSRVRDVSDGRQRYRAKYEIQEQSRRSGVSNYSDVDGRGAAHLQDEADLVGIHKRKSELVSRLLDGDSKIKVIPVVGMGGVGKTTLVKKVYEDNDVKSQFECHAWVAVSTTYNIKELMKTIIKQFCGEMKEPIPHEVESMDDNNLKEFFKKFLLGRKYIIVLDDVWDRNLWEDLKYALSNGGSHSRVLLTTRSKDVAMSSCTDFKRYIYEMKLLSREDSWSLFCNKVFKGDICPSHLEDVSKRILNKCGGLPLAIVAIGGLLGSKDKRELDDWEMVYRSIGVELEGEGMLERVKRILLLSFFNLPHELKVCLLHLSIFPEDHKISCNHVIRLWLAEGFVEEREGLTMEEVGQSYLNKLINGSLLQIVETTIDGRLSTFVIHDIVRKIIVLMSKRENLITIVGERAMRWPSKVRRLAVHGPLENTEETRIFKHLRSLVLFSPKDLPPQPFLSEMLCGGSRVLKVLDLRGAPIEVIPKEVFKLYLLEYLCLRSTKVKVIPKSIGKLRKLETLDLKDTVVTVLPVEILNLHRLVYISNSRTKRTFQAPCKIGCLVSLQKLSYIEADEKHGVKIVEEIGKLRHLRKLGIKRLRKEDGKVLCSSLEKMTNLRSLFVSSGKQMLDLHYNLFPIPSLLRTLELIGSLEKVPQWVSSLQCLTTLILGGSKLEEEPLQYFEDLPNLVKLSLMDAYEGKELHFKAGKFQRLKQLSFRHLNELRKVRVEKSSMPCLEVLYIGQTELMEEFPSGIEHLSNLQYLYLVEMAEKLVKSLPNRQNRSTSAHICVGNLENGRLEWEWV